jgi:predicted nucleotide-binding protein
MGLDEAKRRILAGALKITKEGRLPNDTGSQLHLSNGSIVNCFDNGTVNVQGKSKAETVLVLGKGDSIAASSPVNRKVFVVYGHDNDSRNQLEAMLLRWKLEPIILDQFPSEGATLIEKLEAYCPNVGFGVVLATPDDEAYAKGKPDKKAFRARQNVVLELGMLLAHLGRKKVAILLKDQEDMERPSDIQGLIYIPFKNSLAKEAGLALAKEMVAQGYTIDVKNI